MTHDERIDGYRTSVLHAPRQRTAPRPRTGPAERRPGRPCLGSELLRGFLAAFASWGAVLLSVVLVASFGKLGRVAAGGLPLDTAELARLGGFSVPAWLVLLCARLAWRTARASLARGAARTPPSRSLGLTEARLAELVRREIDLLAARN